MCSAIKIYPKVKVFFIKITLFHSITIFHFILKGNFCFRISALAISWPRMRKRHLYEMSPNSTSEPPEVNLIGSAENCKPRLLRSQVIILKKFSGVPCE